jgi:hypothetical protein
MIPHLSNDGRRRHRQPSNAEFSSSEFCLSSESVCLNFSLEGEKPIPTKRKPFDVLSEGLLIQ